MFTLDVRFEKDLRNLLPDMFIHDSQVLFHRLAGCIDTVPAKLTQQSSDNSLDLHLKLLVAQGRRAFGTWLSIRCSDCCLIVPRCCRCRNRPPEVYFRCYGVPFVDCTSFY